MINESRHIDTKTKTGHKRLNPNALNDYLSEELAREEARFVKITHLSSTINLEPTRKDSKYLTASGKCSYSPTCQVTYIFRVKHKLVVDNAVSVYVEITNSHDHDSLIKPSKKVAKSENRYRISANELASPKDETKVPKRGRCRKPSTPFSSSMVDVSPKKEIMIETSFELDPDDIFSKFFEQEDADNICRITDSIDYSPRQQTEILKKSSLPQKRACEDLDSCCLGLESTPACSNCMDRVYVVPTIHKRMTLCNRMDYDGTLFDTGDKKANHTGDWIDILNTIIEEDLSGFHPNFHLHK